MPTPQKAQATTEALLEALKAEIRGWWEAESTDWDCLVDGEVGGTQALAGDLWDSMPVIDSKSVARTSPIFERHLGHPLDVKLIRPGGYRSIEEMIDDIVPKMAGAIAAA